MSTAVSKPSTEGQAARTVVRFTLVGGAGLALGILTAYGQEWLPPELGSLANSSGSWSLVAFALAFWAPNVRMSAMFGCLTLLALLAGYVLGADIRGFVSSTSLIVFWGAAALLVGPLLGLGAHWVKTGRGLLAAVGIGGMSGVLVGEGIYGLNYIADTTYPPYWWVEIAVGGILLLAGAQRRLQGVLPVSLAVVVTISIAVAFVAGASSDLITIL